MGFFYSFTYTLQLRCGLYYWQNQQVRSKQKVLPEKKIALLIIDYHQELLKRGSERGCDPGAPLTYFNDGGSDRGSYFVPKKIPTFFSTPKKIPQCFCISKFYYLCSGKLKHANFNFGFGQKQNYKLHLCYFWFELMKNTIPKKIPHCFCDPKKSRRLS